MIIKDSKDNFTGVFSISWTSWINPFVFVQLSFLSLCVSNPAVSYIYFFLLGGNHIQGNGVQRLWPVIFVCTLNLQISEAIGLHIWVETSSVFQVQSSFYFLDLRASLAVHQMFQGYNLSDRQRKSVSYLVRFLICISWQKSVCKSCREQRSPVRDFVYKLKI